MQEVEKYKYDVDSAWNSFLEDGTVDDDSENSDNFDNLISKVQDDIPKGTDIYISTKTKIVYLNTPIDLANVFWKIQVEPYHIPKEGVIKKQMKFNFTDEESFNMVEAKFVGIANIDQQIITQIINPSGRIKYKDIRKISVGLCSKDITSYRSKKKSAFYNCFVIIMRIKKDDIYKEIHVKVFNTGKLEIPGIRCNYLLDKVLNLLVKILRPIINNEQLNYDLNMCETVLINSNFNCGFYINRDKLLNILKYKYKIDCIFDACQYPGIQCKYYYTDENGKDYKLSFMIFRTGSILIVGKCDEDILYKIYNYIKKLLIDEYYMINVKNIDAIKYTNKKKKIRKKVIYID